MKKTKKVKTNAESTAIIGNLNIPDDQVWDYKIDGLAAPMIGKTYKNFTVKKILLVIAVLIVVSLSFLFSVIALMSDTFEYEELSDGKYMLSQFSNTGNIRELDIDYVSDVLEEKVHETYKITIILQSSTHSPCHIETFQSQCT